MDWGVLILSIWLWGAVYFARQAWLIWPEREKIAPDHVWLSLWSVAIVAAFWPVLVIVVAIDLWKRA